VRLGRQGWGRWASGGVLASLGAALSLVALVGVAGRGDPRPAVTAISSEIDSTRTPALEPAAVSARAASPPGTTAAPTASTVPPATAAPPPQAGGTGGGSAPQTRARAVTTRALPPGSPGTWAVVMGIDDYHGNGNLQAGVADANEIVATLIDSGVPGQNILLLRNNEVTPTAIVAAADWLVDHAGEDGLAVFAWAGHVRAIDADTEALATGNGGLVTDETLATHLRQLRSRRSWFLIAGCYGGGFTEILGPGRLLTAASTENREAYENSLLGHSYVVEYVIRRGIHRRESPRVVNAAVGWAQQRIRKEHPGREPVSYASGPLEPFVLGPNPTPTPADSRAGG
jgi:hypothetical protein